MMREPFDVAIVGAGPSGVSAGNVLASAGIRTIIFERGEYPGAKNVSGGVLYGHDLAEIIPDYGALNCPIERNIIDSRIWYLSKDSGYSVSYKDRSFSADRK